MLSWRGYSLPFPTSDYCIPCRFMPFTTSKISKYILINRKLCKTVVDGCGFLFIYFEWQHHRWYTARERSTALHGTSQTVGTCKARPFQCCPLLTIFSSRERESTSSITRWMNHPVALENKARRIPLFSPILVKHLVFSCSVIVAIKTDKCRTVCRFTKQKYGMQIILLALWERTSVLFHKYTLVANSLI